MIWGILLTVLKIIGIVLASVLGIAVFLILILLFVPIRYRASFARTGIEGDPPIEAKAAASWLLHLVHVSAVYSGEMKLTVRVAGIPVSGKDKKGKKKKKGKISGEDGPDADVTGTEETSDAGKEDGGSDSGVQTSYDASQNLASDEGTPEIDANTQNDGDGRDSSYSDENDDAQPSGEDNKKQNIFEKAEAFVSRLRCTMVSVYDKIKGVLTGAYDKTEEVKKNIRYYYRILTSDLFERTFEKCKKKVFRLLKEILPKKLDIAMEAGFDDPGTTGELLAVAGMLYPLFGEHVRIKGNFDENIIRGAGRLKGTIFLFSLLKVVIYYYTDRDLKHLIRLLKKEERKRGRKQ